MNQKIYDNISNFAAKKGISISQLERDSGLSNGAISKWKIVSPTISNVKAVAKTLNVTIDDLTKE